MFYTVGGCRSLIELVILPALFLQVKPGSSKFRLESGETKTRDGKTGDKGGKTGDKGGELCRSLLEELDSQAGSCEQAGGARYCC